MTLKHDSGGLYKRAAVGLCIALAWAYIAGGVFLMLQKLPPEDASPLTLYRYWAAYSDLAHVRKSLAQAAMLAALPIAGFLAMLLVPKPQSLFGKARFANRLDVQRSGLLGLKGIIVGAALGRYLLFGGMQHVLMSAPTRSGKGVSVVIPNLLNWPDSVVVLDIKKENFGITSAYRARCGQQCYLFSPNSPDRRSHRWNPLSYIRDDDALRIGDVNRIAHMFYPDKERTDVIWTATPRALFRGIVLYLLETPGKVVSMGQVRRESLADGDGCAYFSGIIHTRALAARAHAWTQAEAQEAARADALAYTSAAKVALSAKQSPLTGEPGRLLDDMAIKSLANPDYANALNALDREAGLDQASDRWDSLLSRRSIDKESVFHSLTTGKPLSPECEASLRTYTSIEAATTRTGVITGFRASLDLWSNPLVDAATSGDDFDLRKLRKERMSVYFGITPDDLAPMAPLINLFFQLLFDVNTRETPELCADIKHPCLVLADEMPAIGRIPILAKGVGYVAGYWLRILAIVQSPAQIVDLYGPEGAKNFITNQACHVIFAPKRTEIDIARQISDWLGFNTVKQVSRSTSPSLFDHRSPTESRSDTKRALMLPQEIIDMGKSKELVIVEDAPPILARKAVYYNDPTFMDRLRLVSPSLAAVRRPKKHHIDAAIASGELSASVPELDLEAIRRLARPAASPSQAQAAASPANAVAPESSAVLVERPASLDDIPNLHLFGLENFAVDFSAVPTPARPAEGQQLDVKALHAWTDALCREAGLTVLEEEN